MCQKFSTALPCSRGLPPPATFFLLRYFLFDRLSTITCLRRRSIRSRRSWRRRGGPGSRSKVWASGLPAWVSPPLECLQVSGHAAYVDLDELMLRWAAHIHVNDNLIRRNVTLWHFSIVLNHLPLTISTSWCPFFHFPMDLIRYIFKILDIYYISFKTDRIDLAMAFLLDSFGNLSSYLFGKCHIWEWELSWIWFFPMLVLPCITPSPVFWGIYLWGTVCFLSWFGL